MNRELAKNARMSRAEAEDAVRRQRRAELVQRRRPYVVQFAFQAVGDPLAGIGLHDVPRSGSSVGPEAAAGR